MANKSNNYYRNDSKKRAFAVKRIKCLVPKTTIRVGVFASDIYKFKHKVMARATEGVMFTYFVGACLMQHNITTPLLWATI